MGKNIKRVISKCLVLIEDGHSVNYCIDKFKDYRDEINEYFRTVDSIKKLNTILPEKDYMENSFSKVISEAERRKSVSSGKAISQAAIRQNAPVSKRRLLLRPAMIFLVFLVLVTFSFTGTLFASQETVPGQVLYPFKKSFEGFQLVIYPENRKDELHFEFLGNRIDEAEILLESDKPESDLLVENLIGEIDNQYQVCKQYNCFSFEDEDLIIQSINSIKNRHRNRYRNNQKDEKGPGQEDTSGNDQEGNMNSNPDDSGNADQQNTDNGKQQNRNGKNSKNN